MSCRLLATRYHLVGAWTIILLIWTMLPSAASDVTQSATSLVIEKPDLTMGELLVSPSSVAPGQKLRVRFQPRCVGKLGGGFYVDIHLTNYPRTVNDQTRIHRAAIGAGYLISQPTFPLSFEYTVPPNKASGDYYIVAVADATNAIAEKAESNNTLAKPFAIQRINATAAAPASRLRTSVKLANLRINPASARDGDHVVVGCDVINDGQTRIASTRVSIVLWDQEPVIVDSQTTYQMRAHPMVSIPIRDLAPGSTLPVAAGIRVPWNIGAPAGGDTIKAELDPEELLHEPHADNGLSGILDITVAQRPDLKPIVEQNSAGSGQMDSTVAFRMSLVIVNVGDRASLPSVCKVKFQHRGTDGQWANMLGGAEHEIPVLAPGTFYRVEHAYDARGWFSGTVKMIITADADERMIEPNERNNVEERTFIKPQPHY